MDEGGICRMVEGVEGFTGGEEFEAKGFDLAAGGSVDDEYGGGHVGDDAVERVDLVFVQVVLGRRRIAFQDTATAPGGQTNVGPARGGG